MASHGRPKILDQELQLKDVRRQLGDHLGCLELRMESKLSLLAEFQEFFKRRGEVEYEYARSLERLCERFERNTKQRNLRNEVRSTFNLWSTLLAETRKMSRERASLAEVMASEMVARVDVMVKDVQGLTKKCKDICVDIQDQFLKELRDLSEQTKVYHHSCHNTAEAYGKAFKGKEKLDSIKGPSARRKKAEDKLKEKQKQYKVQKHLLLKNRNDYLLGISRCNALSTQYFSVDVMDIVEHMDFDYHDSFQRLVVAYKDSERETCEAIMFSGEALVEQTKTLNFENDLHYFLSEYSGPFTAPNYFQFTPFEGDDVSSFKVNTEDVFKRWSKTMSDLKEEIQTLQIQREEDIKTIQHIQQVNLRRYQITSIDDALAVIEDNGDGGGLDNSKERGNSSLERGLSLVTRGGQAIVLSQKGKKDTLNFTLQISQRRILRADRLAVANAQLDVLESAFNDQKVPPVPVGVDSQGRTIPGEVPKLFGGEIVKYILATGCEIPLVVVSCVNAIEKHGMKMEGLFRVPGPAAVLDELRLAFEEGRDPLAGYTQAKLDVAAVASTLKAYFRELSTPLFPTHKYQDFIGCTRQEDASSRLDALKTTIYSLPPQVVSVMRFLFRFLHRVSLHSSDNKMGTANIALVFGPTLTRAPDSLDPRQLHNDVPSVNILIQMCIEGHEYIFGDAGDTPTTSPTQDVPVETVPLSTSPPSEPPSAPPSATVPPQDIPEVSTQQDGYEEEVCELPPPPCPPKPVEDVQLPPDDAPPPPRPPKPEAMTPPPPPSLEEESTSIQPETAMEVERAADQEVESVMSELSVVKPSPERESPRDQDSSATSQTSGLDLSSLDAKMQEIEDSLHDLSESATPTPSADQDEEMEGEEVEDDTDSEDDDDLNTGMRIGARALYDYEARSDKELTFNQSDTLEVITKTPDNNWWDGFHNGRRGFIPVAYVEITELKTSPSPPLVEVPPVGSASLPVPAPPQRKSSIPTPAEVESASKPRQPSIVEEPHEEEELSSDIPTDERPEDPELSSVSSPTVTVSKEVQELEAVKSPSDVTPPTAANFPVKSVLALTKQFQEPEPAQPKVLVEPHTHRRHGSDIKAPTTESRPDACVSPPRSSSTGSKVSTISSNFKKGTAPAPPTRPKPAALAHPAPLSPASGGVFPLMQHPGAAGMPGVSPLQQVAHQSQHKPALGKKPAPQATKQTGKPKSTSAKLKKKDSLKEKDRGSKPVVTQKPPGFAATPQEIQAQLQARAKRKQSEDKL